MDGLDDLDLHTLSMFESTFSLDAAYMELWCLTRVNIVTRLLGPVVQSFVRLKAPYSSEIDIFYPRKI